MFRPPIHADPLAAALARKRTSGARGDFAETTARVRRRLAGAGHRLHLRAARPRSRGADRRQQRGADALGQFRRARPARHVAAVRRLVPAGQRRALLCLLASPRRGRPLPLVPVRAGAVRAHRARCRRARPAFAHNRLPPLRAARAAHRARPARDARPAADGGDRDRASRHRARACRAGDSAASAALAAPRSHERGAALHGGAQRGAAHGRGPRRHGEA